MLNSDELGEKGEAKFREICADAKLISNGSTRDRKGWDFLVEFPFADTDNTVSLDRRLPALSCYVQVKTIWAKQSSPRIKLRLSSAEGLAKEPRPTFIYIFQVNKDLSFSESYLIEMAGPSLSMVLCKLRLESERGNDKINQKYIYVDIKKFGTEIPADGKSLKDSILKACGDDVVKYINRKTSQLTTLGYENRPWNGSFSVHLSDGFELLDFLLGRKEGNVTEATINETRFGVTLPVAGPSNGVVKIEPNPIDDAVVTLRSKTSKIYSRFNAKCFGTFINLNNEIYQKIVVKSDVVEFTLTSPGKTISVSSDSKNLERKFRAETWLNYFRFVDILSNDDSSLTIELNKGDLISISMQKQNIADDDNLREKFLTLFECVDKLFSRFGLRDLEINYSDLSGAAGYYIILEKMLSGDHCRGFLNVKRLESHETDEIGDNVDILFIGNIGILDFSICYYAIITMHKVNADENVTFSSGEILNVHADVLRNPNARYDSFVNRAKSEYPLENVVVQPLGHIAQWQTG